MWNADITSPIASLPSQCLPHQPLTGQWTRSFNMQTWSCISSTLHYCPSFWLPIGLRVLYIYISTVLHELHEVGFCYLTSFECYHSTTITLLPFVIFTPGGYVTLQSVISWSLYFVWGKLYALHLVLESLMRFFSFKNSYSFCHISYFCLCMHLYSFLILNIFWRNIYHIYH